MSHSAKFWNRMAAGYARRPVADEASYQKKLAITRSYLKPGMAVLEFGCGTGSTAITHAPHVAHIHAIDISTNMIEIARRKAADAGVRNVTFECATLDSFMAPAEAFDVVLGLSILHLLPDRRGTIAKVYTMLKPGGIFVSSTICLGDSMKWLRPIVPAIAWLFGLVLRFFTSTELLHEMKDAGFNIDHEWRPGPNKAVFIIAKKPVA
ncbi:MAG: class I SAM-dependent methyltransferase [Alphaproteobacteria bacterium]